MALYQAISVHDRKTWKATKEYLNHKGTKIRVFECALGPLSSHPFSFVFPTFSPSGHHHFSPLHLPLYPPFKRFSPESSPNSSGKIFVRKVLCSTLLVTLEVCPLSRELLWIFSSSLPGNSALKNGGIFGEFKFLIWSPFPTKRSTKTHQKIDSRT